MPDQKLPKTADGALVVSGMKLFCTSNRGIYSYVVRSIEERIEFGWIVKAQSGGWIAMSQAYSIRKAAEAARKAD